MQEIIVRYARPAVVIHDKGYIAASYPESSLPINYDDTFKFIKESVAHAGLVALLKQALVKGVAKYEVDESIADGFTLLAAIGECKEALKPEGFEIAVSVPTETPFDVNGKVYSSLTEAINDIEDGAVITLSANGASAGISVAEGKNFTIDLNGYELSMNGPGAGSHGTETNGFQFLKDSTVVIKNGIMSAHEGIKILVQNYSNLTLDNVQLYGYEGTQYVASNNFGNIVYKNHTSFNPVGDNVAFDVWYGMQAVYDDGVKVTVADDTVQVNGRVEYGKAARASEELFETNARLTVPADMDIYIRDIPDGYHWVVDGTIKYLGK